MFMATEKHILNFAQAKLIGTMLQIIDECSEITLILFEGIEKVAALDVASTWNQNDSSFISCLVAAIDRTGSLTNLGARCLD